MSSVQHTPRTVGEHWLDKSIECAACHHPWPCATYLEMT